MTHLTEHCCKIVSALLQHTKSAGFNNPLQILDGVHVAELGNPAERLFQRQEKSEFHIQLPLNQSSKSGL